MINTRLKNVKLRHNWCFGWIIEFDLDEKSYTFRIKNVVYERKPRKK